MKSQAQQGAAPDLAFGFGFRWCALRQRVRYSAPNPAQPAKRVSPGPMLSPRNRKKIRYVKTNDYDKKPAIPED
jgi:hypothetical protein